MTDSAYGRREHAGAAVDTTVVGTINGTATTITIAASTNWPTGGTGKFYAVLDEGTASEEKILITSRSGTTLTLAASSDRGIDGTTGVSHTDCTIRHCFTAKEADEANQAVYNTLGKITATGDSLYADSTTTLAKRAIGTTGQLYQVSGGVPVWGGIPTGAISSAAMFAAGAVDQAALATDSVGSAEIIAAAVDSAEIASGAVDLVHMSANSVDSDQYVDGSIDTAHFAAGAVDTAALTKSFLADFCQRQRFSNTTGTALTGSEATVGSASVTLPAGWTSMACEVRVDLSMDTDFTDLSSNTYRATFDISEGTVGNHITDQAAQVGFRGDQVPGTGTNNWPANGTMSGAYTASATSTVYVRGVRDHGDAGPLMRMVSVVVTKYRTA